jgi:hypothetical protein
MPYLSMKMLLVKQAYGPNHVVLRLQTKIAQLLTYCHRYSMGHLLPVTQNEKVSKLHNYIHTEMNHTLVTKSFARFRKTACIESKGRSVAQLKPTACSRASWGQPSRPKRAILALTSGLLQSVL